MHMVPANVNDKYVIRFCAVAQNATEEDVGKKNKKYESISGIRSAWIVVCTSLLTTFRMLSYSCYKPLQPKCFILINLFVETGLLNQYPNDSQL